MFFLKFLMPLLKVFEVTCEHQKWPKISKKSIKTICLSKDQKSLRQRPKQCTPQELIMSPHSGLYLLVDT